MALDADTRPRHPGNKGSPPVAGDLFYPDTSNGISHIVDFRAEPGAKSSARVRSRTWPHVTVTLREHEPALLNNHANVTRLDGTEFGTREGRLRAGARVTVILRSSRYSRRAGA